MVTRNKNKRPEAGQPDSRRGTAPLFVTPMAAQVVQELPQGDGWLYEIKLDGYRGLLIKDGQRVELRSRNHRDLTRTYPSIVQAARRLKAEQAVVDGEIVALDGQGRPDFQALQHRGTQPHHRIVFYAFDLLHLDGAALTTEPLVKRREQLRKVLKGSELLLSQELPGTPAAIVEAVRGLGLEGVVAKRKDSVYEPGERSGAWQKLKLELSQEFVVGGYRPGFNAIDALLVGYYDGSRLRFAGKVKAGFVAHVRRDLYQRLQSLHTDMCSFANLPDSKTSRWGGGVTADEMDEMQWVKPKLVVQVKFVEWTADGRLRHAAFLGLRSDKEARDVRRETPREIGEAGSK
jgi:bifunctional non-homologous end joining protein LigD